jgi:hypothetical protein
MTIKTEQEAMNIMVAAWANNPILGVKQLFGVEPSEQQKKMIRAAWIPKSRVARSSCQGAGKTACLTWLTYLFLLTQEDCRILITSPSAQQLNRVFNSELEKWKSKMPPQFQKQFIVNKEKVALKGMEGFQFASLVTASAEHRENLQGGHSKNYIILADEASGIEEDIFDVLLGTLGTKIDGVARGRMIMTSNPLRASGRFYETFTTEGMEKKWDLDYFSAHESPIISKDWIDEMADRYGEDSDIYRVRVLGRFPRRASSQFFSSDSVGDAIKNKLQEQVYGYFPRIVGADIARFGDDRTVFVCRQGPKILDITTFNGLDTMQVAAELHEYYRKYKAGLIAIDAIGIGAGVFDRCKQLMMPVHQVVVSQKSTDPRQFFNLRSQLYGLMKLWLENGADLPKEQDMKKQMLSMEYGYNQKMQVQMIAKKDLKAKGLASPDIPDAIALTFIKEALNVMSGGMMQARQVRRSNHLWV